jgi:HPt (histidine-containing phosphotransfer) domain-containing protein
MTLQELYAAIDGSYDDAIARLGSDALIERILGKFLDDTTCPDVIEAWNNGDEAAAFEAAHAAKGVCMNLAFVRLGALASEITEALRPGNEALRASADVDALVSELAAEYELVRSNVSAYLEAR